MIVFQAATAAGATPAQASSWIMALCLGMGLTCILLSLRYRMPIVTAWSTPGAALLATSLVGVPMSEAIGAFLFSALLILIFGITGWFERLMSKVPLSISSALLAGVLVRFGFDLFSAMKERFVLVVTMFFVYLLVRRSKPRYAVLATLAVSAAIAYAQNLLKLDSLRLEFAVPVWTTPTFSAAALLGVGLPLFIVTMASQNIPGVAALHAAGYRPPVSPIVAWTGATTLLIAPFGGYAINLAAITASICMGKEAHEDPKRRYMASVFTGIFYLIVGLFGATVASLFAAFPKEMVAALAGLALLGTIGASLAQATADESKREPALVAFLVTASGVSLFGIGSAFWGLVGGTVATIVAQKLKLD